MLLVLLELSAVVLVGFLSEIHLVEMEMYHDHHDPQQPRISEAISLHSGKNFSVSTLQQHPLWLSLLLQVPSYPIEYALSNPGADIVGGP